MNWEKDKRYANTFFCTEIFNDYKYVVSISTEERSKSIRFWVFASSGKKRSELEIYEDKPNKSFGGIRALLWMKKAVLSFPDYYHRHYRTEGMKLIICIAWADSKRKRVYERLKKEGFFFSHIDGNETLIKKITELKKL